MRVLNILTGKRTASGTGKKNAQKAMTYIFNFPVISGRQEYCNPRVLPDTTTFPGQTMWIGQSQ